MRKFESNSVKWAAAWLMPLVMAIAAGVAMPEACEGAAPPNDNFANAEVLAESSGTVVGTNYQATSESGEPVHVDGFVDYASVWYSWTAPTNGTVTFEINAAVVNGSTNTLDTVLAAYSGESLSTLSSVANNDDASSSNTLSSITFNITNGATYYIAVDSWPYDSGVFLLVWNVTGNTNTVVTPISYPLTNGSAGTFYFASGFSSSRYPAIYNFSDQTLTSQSDSSYDVQTYLQPRAVITRTDGYKGRVYIDYVVTNELYTNLCETNVYCEFVTNTDSTTSTTTISSNATVYYKILYGFGGKYSGYVVVSNVMTTNWLGGNPAIATGTDYPGEDISGAPANGWVTNYPVDVVEQSNYLATVTNVTLVTNVVGTVTNITSLTNVTTETMTVDVTNVINGALTYTETAEPGVDYSADSGTIEMDDYQMEYDIYPRVFATHSFFKNPADVLASRDKIVLVKLSNIRFAPEENLDTSSTNVVTNIEAPQLGDASTAAIKILNTSYEDNYDYASAVANGTTNWPVVNFEMSNYRVLNGVGSMNVYATRTEGSCSVEYHVDWDASKLDNSLHTWETEPGSEYALPDVDFTAVNGTVSWSDTDVAPKAIAIPILTNSTVQFNRDLLVTLNKVSTSDEVFIGRVYRTTVTILYDMDWDTGIQSAGSVDRTFNPDYSLTSEWNYGKERNYPPGNIAPGANKTVYSVASQTDGKVVIAGAFTSLDGYPVNRVARMTTGGWPDTDFDIGSGANNTVTSVLVDSNQRLVVGGLFTSFNGVNRYHVARLNADGSLDTDFKPGLGANGIVWAMTLQSDGKIVLAGDFTSYNGTNRNHVARINSDGSLDTDFDPGVGPNGSVLAVAVESGGGILIGGDFSSVSGTSMSSIARLTASGAVDSTFDIGSGGIDGPVYSLVEQTDGKVVLGGAFTTVNYLSRNNIARLKANGNVDESFDPGSGTDGGIYALTLQSDGKILAGGLFTQYNQTRRVGFVRLFTSGSVDTSFMDTAYNQFAGIPNHYANPLAYDDTDYSSAQNTRNSVLSMSVLPSGKIVIGGQFTRVGGGLTRNDIRTQLNVARIIGGSTPGPGNIQFDKSTYSVNENQGQFFVSMVRTNGNLGVVGAMFGTNTYGVGPGALGADDFTLSSYYEAPTWDTYWPGPLVTLDGQHVNYGWQKSDCLWGPNYDESPSGDSFAYVYLGIVDDYIVNGNRTAALNLGTPFSSFFLGHVNIPLGAALGTSSAVLQVVDNDVKYGEFSFASTNYIINENGVTVTLDIIRTNGSSGLATIDYATVNGSAVNKVDYYANSGTLSFPEGVTNKQISVTIKDNTVVQPDRYFYVKIANPGGQATLNTNASVATVTIVDDDFLAGHLSFSATNFNVSETATSAVVTITRRGGSVGTLSVQYAVSDGTAINNINYVGTTNTLKWNSGDITSRYIYVPVIHDNKVTDNLKVNLQLFNPVISGDSLNENNPVVLASQVTNATVTILNEDYSGYLQFAAANLNIMENSGTNTITVYRKYGSSGEVSVGVRTIDDTAKSGTNYVGVTNRLTFAAGEMSKTFTLKVLDDSVTNADRVLMLQLFNPSPTNALNMLGLYTNATVTIVDNETTHEPAGSVDVTYYIGEGFNDFILGMSAQPDGKVLVSGNFTYANKAVRNRIARMNTDGSLDSTFLLNQSGANDTVRAVLSQTPDPSLGMTNGPILVAGSFSTLDGVNRSSIGRLNIDGSLDGTFDPGSGADNAIFTVLESVSSGNGSFTRKVIIGGSFGSYDGQTASGIARINDDGTLDNTFQVGSGVDGTNGTVFALAAQSDGSILAGGDFVAFDGYVRKHLVRLSADGVVDETFNPNVGDSVRTIVIQDDGKILIGGVFTNVNGQNFNHLARLNSDGSIDNTFKIGVGFNDTVLAIALNPQGKIVVGGEFTRANGTTRNRVTQINSDGTVDPGMNFGYGADSFVSGILLQDDGKIILGGGFNTFNQLAYPHLVRLYGGSMFDSGTLEFDSPTYTVSENGTNVTVLVRRLGGTYNTASGSLGVDVVTEDGTGIAGKDYSALTNSLVFPAGETFLSVVIPIIDNYNLDGTRAFYVALTNFSASSAIGPQPSAEVDIIDDECGVSFSQGNYRVMENIASGTALIQLVREGNTNAVFSIDVMTTTNGTAKEGVRFYGITNTVTFGVGETNKNVYMPLIDDSTVIGDQTVDVILTNLVGSSSAILMQPSKAEVVIVEDDTAAGKLMFSQSAFYAQESDSNAVVEIVRTNGSTGPISIDYMTTNGTAVAGNHYTATNGTLVFADGELSKKIYIPVIENSRTEGNLTFSILLSNPTGGTSILGSNSTVVTIVDDDVGVGFSQPTYYIDELSSFVVLSVARMGGSNGVVYVDYKTINGTAKTGVNYTGTTNKLRFADGETLKTFSIPILHDSLVTGNQNFQISLSVTNPNVQLSSIPTANVVIVDGDNGFSFSTNSYTVSEESNIVVTVVRSGSVLRSNMVYFATSDGTAVAGDKYYATNGSLAFAAGVVTRSIELQIIDNAKVDGDKYFNISLSSPTDGAQLVSPSNAVVNIIDNDIGLSFSSPTYSVSECGVKATIGVIRTGLTNDDVSVAFSAYDGTAVTGANYVATNGVLEFEPGQETNSFTVQVIDDNRILGDSTVLLSLQNATDGATIQYPVTATLTIRECDGTLIEPAGVALTSESITPTNGMIDAGETVTVWFGLRNVSGQDTTNLTATLASGNGISNIVNATQSYGALKPDSHSVSMPFTFKAAATNGQRIMATFSLKDGTRTNFEDVSFSFDVGQHTVSGTNDAQIVINDDSEASPYPSVITMSGVSGVLNGVSITLSNFTHSYPSDVSVMLTSPDNRKALLMSKCGGGVSVKNATLTFRDSATTVLSDTALIASGTNRPSIYTATNLFDYLFDPPAPVGTMNTNLSVFNGLEANGKWSLYVVDSKAMDSGAIGNGWRISFSTGTQVGSDADLETTVTPSGTNGVVGNNLTYTITVTNYGPGSATNVVISDILPSGMTYVSGPVAASAVSDGQWSYTLAKLDMPKLVGSKLQYSGVSFTMVLQPTVVGTATNVLAVASTVDDLNLTNNTATTAIPIEVASADLAVSMTESPNPIALGGTMVYTITMTNKGPSRASSVMLTNELPDGGVLLTTLDNSTLVDGVLIANLGDMEINAQKTISLSVRAGAYGTVTNTVRIGSSVLDKLKANNIVSVKTEVEAPASITVVRQANGFNITWPVGGNYVLESTTNLSDTTVWVEVTTPAPTIVDGNYVVPVTYGESRKFFRLRIKD